MGVELSGIGGRGGSGVRDTKEYKPIVKEANRQGNQNTCSICQVWVWVGLPKRGMTLLFQ